MKGRNVGNSFMLHASKPPAPEHSSDQHDAKELSKAEKRLKLEPRERTLKVQEWKRRGNFLVLGRLLLEEEPEGKSQLQSLGFKSQNRHILAGVVVAEGEDTDNTGPSTCNLPGELAGSVLSVSAETEETTKSDDSNGVTEDDGVIAVGLGLLCGLLCLLLDLLLDLLGLLGLLAGLGLKTLALGLSLGLDLL